MKALPIKTSKGSCWCCNSETFSLFELNDFPLTGRFPKKGEETMTGDLSFSVCKDCKLIQLEQAYSPEDLYSEYYYRSSINNTMRNHLANLVIDIINNYGFKKPGKWLDIGCNDGFTISIPKILGWSTKGIDPSNVIGQYFKELFLKNNYQDEDFINDIFPPRKKKMFYEKFDVISTISMFYDICELENFIDQIDKSLSKKGIWVVEMNYTLNMIKDFGYDMISHEHITYFTLTSFIFALEKLKPELRVFNTKLTPINGGSITIYIDRGIRKIDKSVNMNLDIEEKMGLNSIPLIKEYFANIKNHSESVSNFIESLKKENKTISIYGASTRGNTNILLSKLNKNTIDYAYEKNTDKISRFCPGSDIEIKDEKELNHDNPDYLIVMPYSFIDEFRIKESTYLKNGGKMITLVPEIRIYED